MPGGGREEYNGPPHPAGSPPQDSPPPRPPKQRLRLPTQTPSVAHLLSADGRTHGSWCCVYWLLSSLGPSSLSRVLCPLSALHSPATTGSGLHSPRLSSQFHPPGMRLGSWDVAVVSTTKHPPLSPSGCWFKWFPVLCRGRACGPGLGGCCHVT